MDAAPRVGPRVYVEDTRRNGGFLRITWHGDHDQFVVSNWEDNLCVGATRVPLDEAPIIVSALVEGLADAAARARSETVAPPSPRTLREHLRAWWHERGRRAQVLPIERSLDAGRDRLRPPA